MAEGTSKNDITPPRPLPQDFNAERQTLGSPQPQSQPEPPPLPPEPPKQLIVAKAQGNLGKSTSAEIQKLAAEGSRLLNAQLMEGVALVWSSALLVFPLFLGALIGDFLWAFKKNLIRKIIEPFLKTDELKQQGDLIANQIKISGLVKANILAFNALSFAIPAALILLIITLACNDPLYSRLIAGVSGGGATGVVTGNSEICKNFTFSANAGPSFGNGGSSGGGGASGSFGGPLNLSADLNAKINAFAGQVDVCMLKVVVEKESAGDSNVIGCDCQANGQPQLCTDSAKDYYSGYRFNWNSCSYGIGLTQWTIYPQGGTGYKAWSSPSTPSRDVLGAFYGVTDFLNPDLSLSLTAQVLAVNYNKSTATDTRGKVQDAFTAYVGQSSQTASLVASRMALYDLCTSQGSLPQ